MAMVLLAHFKARLKNRTPIFTQPPARFVFIFQRVAVFIGDSVEAQIALVSWSARREDQACTSPRRCLFPSVSKGGYIIFFSLCKSFSCETRNNLAQPMKVNALEGAVGRSFFPTGSHASQQCISVPRCLFLCTRNAVQAVKSFAPGLLGVLRRSS